MGILVCCNPRLTVSCPTDESREDSENEVAYLLCEILPNKIPLDGIFLTSLLRFLIS